MLRHTDPPAGLFCPTVSLFWQQEMKSMLLPGKVRVHTPERWTVGLHVPATNLDYMCEIPAAQTDIWKLVFCVSSLHVDLQNKADFGKKKRRAALTYRHDHVWNRQLVGSCPITQGAQLDAPWWPRGRGLGRRVKKEGMYVYMWLIDTVAQQNLTQHYKAVILQFKKKEASLNVFSLCAPEDRETDVCL